MEDLLLYSKTYEINILLLRLLFKTANDNNVSFNKQKTSFAKPTAISAGYEVSTDGFQPNPELTKIIREFPRPSNVTDLQTFCGLCQQVGNFSYQIAAALAPLFAFLKKSGVWEWSDAPNWRSFWTQHSTIRAGQHRSRLTPHC